MVQIPPFEVEQWFNKYENTPGVLNISETCASSISLDELVQLNSRGDAASPLDFSARMTYGAIPGSAELRRNIAALHGNDDEEGSGRPLSPDDIIVTPGAISANYLVFYSLVGPGDHVVCVFPTYQQLYAVPESLGAEVSRWELRAERGYVPDVSELEALIQSNTKMIVINNPNNPTGATMSREVLTDIVAVARRHDITVFSDEVYRPLFHSLGPSATPPPPTALSLHYDKVIVTSSMSKAWALAGLRVGWLASWDADLIEKIAAARDYTTISVSQLDDQAATYALSESVRPRLLERNMELARTNVRMLGEFVVEHAEACSWTRPMAGTTAFLQFRRRGDGEPVDDEAFCLDVLEKTRVMLVPGSRCFGDGRAFRGFVRIGYVNETAVVEEALRRLGRYVVEHLT